MGFAESPSDGKNGRIHLVVFGLEGQRYALRLSAVERIVRAVEVTPLPKGPQIVLGVVNVRGSILPVFNIRRRFNLAEKQLDPNQQLVLARAGQRFVGLLVDSVEGLVECPEEEVVAAIAVLPGVDYVEGVVKLEDGVLLIHNLNRFLSLEEEQALDEALTSKRMGLE